MSRTVSRLALVLPVLFVAFVQAQLAAALTVVKTDAPDPVPPGGNLTYTIVVSNEGPADETNLSLTDTLPAETTFVSLTFPGGWSCTTPAVGAGGTVTCTLATLSLESAAFALTVKVGAGVAAGTIFSNTATLSADSGEVSDTTTTTVGVESSALTIAIADSPDPVAVGSTVTYTVTAFTSLTDATDYVFTFPIPAETTFQSFSTSSGTGLCSAPAPGATGTVTCTDSAFAPGSITYTIAVLAGPGFAPQDEVEATASVRVMTDGRDAVATDDETTGLLFPASVSATKTVAGTFAPGGSIAYTIVLSNAGPAVQADNAGDEFIDILPAGLLLASATASSGTAAANVGTNTVTWNGSIPANGSVTITINATIAQSTLLEMPISNQGSFAYDADGNGTNEASGLTDDPGVAGPADPTVIAISGLAAVPTLGEWGLALFALLLAAGGTLLLRRRAGA